MISFANAMRTDGLGKGSLLTMEEILQIILNSSQNAAQVTLFDGSGNPITSANPLAVTATPAAASTADFGISSKRFPTSALLLGAAQSVKASAGNVFGMTFINPNTVPEFLKFYDLAAGSVTPGTTIPLHTVEVPANDGTNDGQLIITPGTNPLWQKFSTAISVFATSVRDDTGSTAPSTGLLGEVFFA